MRGMAWAALMAALIVLQGCAATRSSSEAWVFCSDRDPAVIEKRIEACGAITAMSGETARKRAVAYNNRGNSYSKLEQYDRALQDYDAGLALAPDNPFLIANRAQVRAELGARDAAIADLDAALRHAPDDAHLHQARCGILAERGKPVEAIANCETARRLAPSARQDNNLAWALYAAGRSREALPIAERSVANSFEHSYFDTLAHIQLDLGEVDAARKSFHVSADLADAFQLRSLKKALVARGFDPGPIDAPEDDRLRKALDACITARCRLHDPEGPKP